MTRHLENTTASQINREIAAERHRIGATATGMVLNLVIVTDEEHQSEAARAASFSANQHPCRILVVIPRPGRGETRLDAEINVVDEDGPGETIHLRLFGALANHRASVVLPLLLPDTPVVAWWAGRAPDDLAADEIGLLAQRRITDSADSRKPVPTLLNRAATYRPGDTDLAWTRTTIWRSMLAASLDEPFPRITSAQIFVKGANPSALLLAGWLRTRLGVLVEILPSRGPQITEVRLKTIDGDITVTRPDGQMATLERLNFTSRRIPLPVRDLRELVAEELRRLDADETYAEALAHLEVPSAKPSPKARSKARVEKTAPKKSKPRSTA